jgi:hypothetical protein
LVQLDKNHSNNINGAGVGVGIRASDKQAHKEGEFELAYPHHLPTKGSLLWMMNLILL